KLELAFEVRRNVIPMRDVTNPGEWLCSLKCLGGGGQPRINPSNDAHILGRGQFCQALLNLQGNASMMGRAEVPPVLGAWDLAGAQESQVNGYIHELRCGGRRGFFL